MSSQIQIYIHGISVGDQLSIDCKKLSWDYNSFVSILSLTIIENSHLSLNQSDAYLIKQCFTPFKPQDHHAYSPYCIHSKWY